MKPLTSQKLIDDKATGPPKVRVDRVAKNGTSMVSSIVRDKDQSKEDFRAGLKEATGVNGERFASFIFTQASLVTCNLDGDVTTGSANNILGLMHEIKPQNGLESLLTTQMVNTHMLANEMMHRASLPKQTPEGVDRNINRATKLMRVFNAQIDTLQKLRGKGQQKITVEHVNVKEMPDEELLRIIHRGSEGTFSEEVSQNDDGEAIVDVTYTEGGE